MIPKKIHYCWFGSKPLPKSAMACIDSWKHWCPDFEIIEWNENNINLSSCKYMEQAYKQRAWGFVPDVARLQIIAKEGGFYFDTDVELVAPLDSLLEYEAVFGFEDDKYVNLGHGFGAVPNNPIVLSMLEDYDDKLFIDENGHINKTPSPYYQTAVLLRNGLRRENVDQSLHYAKVFASDVLSPIDYYSGKMTLSTRTISIHHFVGSWISESRRKTEEKRRALVEKYGTRIGVVIWQYFRIKNKIGEIGIKESLYLIMKRVF